MTFKKVFTFFLNVIRFHKLKIFVFIFSTLIFLIILFPFEDISDMVTSQISQLTYNQVYLEFEDMSLHLIPSPGISFDHVAVEGALIPQLSADKLSISPSLTSLFTLKSGGQIQASGFLGGDLRLKFKESGLSVEKTPIWDLSLLANDLELTRLKKLLGLPLSLKGQLSVDSRFKIDPTMGVQPDGDIELDTKKLMLPNSTIPTPFGELPFPEMNFSGVQWKARWVGSELIFENLILGNEKDNFSVHSKGKVGLELKKVGSRILPQFGPYDFRCQLVVKKDQNSTLKLFLNFLDKFKTPGSTSDRFMFRAKGQNFNLPPDISAISQI